MLRLWRGSHPLATQLDGRNGEMETIQSIGFISGSRDTATKMDSHHCTANPASHSVVRPNLVLGRRVRMTRALTALNSGSLIAIFACAINLGHECNDNEKKPSSCLPRLLAIAGIRGKLGKRERTRFPLSPSSGGCGGTLRFSVGDGGTGLLHRTWRSQGG